MNIQFFTEVTVWFQVVTDVAEDPAASKVRVCVVKEDYTF
jgi:hypothetical protein